MVLCIKRYSKTHYSVQCNIPIGLKLVIILLFYLAVDSTLPSQVLCVHEFALPSHIAFVRLRLGMNCLSHFNTKIRNMLRLFSLTPEGAHPTNTFNRIWVDFFHSQTPMIWIFSSNKPLVFSRKLRFFTFFKYFAKQITETDILGDYLGHKWPKNRNVL